MSSLRYVALGDSYTIGTSVGESERWPNQLVSVLDGALEVVANLGVNGYTSADLFADELPRLAALRPEFVTLLIGVNDVVQGVPWQVYARNVALILDELAERDGLGPDHLLGIATPDYTMTPQGAAFGDPTQQRAGIARNNEVLAAACATRGIRFVPEIFAISHGAADRSMVASDGLHPSGAQYTCWVEVIAPAVRELLAPG